MWAFEFLAAFVIGMMLGGLAGLILAGLCAMAARHSGGDE